MKNTIALSLTFWFLSCLLVNCQNPSEVSDATNESEKFENTVVEIKKPLPIVVGAERTTVYMPLIKGKTVALVVNQTSKVGEQHLVDKLLEDGIKIKAIFAPEHGFRGKADAGATISNGKDTKTGLPIISLYGKHKKPYASDLAGVDVVLFDIQDVGARFYTYISTMHYVMEACAEQGKPFMVLDRPNPNGHYVDGPALERGNTSFVGMHVNVPVVHGMTVGEYAKMVNNEKWLKNGVKCDLTVVKCENYDHNTFYELPEKPSPNLPNIRSIYLYPSLCLFEGTVVSVGRGTDTPFQIYGHPEHKAGNYEFVPRPTEGATQPLCNGQTCNGFAMTQTPIEDLRKEARFNLNYLIDFYQNYPNKKAFFNNFFVKLAGTVNLQRQIESGKTEPEIRATWQKDLTKFKNIRKKYLLYADFE